MPIDFSHAQQKLIEKLQSQAIEKAQSPGEADAQQASQFRDAMSVDGPNNGAAPAGIASQEQNHATVTSLPDVAQTTLSPGDQILNNLARMSEHARQIQQVAAGSGAAGGDVNSAMHAQIEMVNIVGAAGTATDAANKSSQSAEALLKS